MGRILRWGVAATLPEFSEWTLTVNGLLTSLENGMSPSTPLNGCEINARSCFA